MSHQTLDCLDLSSAHRLLAISFTFPSAFALGFAFDHRVDFRWIVGSTCPGCHLTRLRFHDLADATIQSTRKSQVAHHRISRGISHLPAMSFQIIQNNRLNRTASDVVSKFHFNDLGVLLVVATVSSRVCKAGPRSSILTRCGAMIARNGLRRLPPINGSNIVCVDLSTLQDRFILNSARSSSFLLP